MLRFYSIIFVCKTDWNNFPLSDETQDPRCSLKQFLDLKSFLFSFLQNSLLCDSTKKLTEEKTSAIFEM